mmetsp:Transcript_2951/g.6832  ORF Transcript_2951/g.6832 Transcript_2951/m.6832 type:complete len:223 (-) Transcript_2951:91-759(-)
MGQHTWQHCPITRMGITRMGIICKRMGTITHCSRQVREQGSRLGEASSCPYTSRGGCLCLQEGIELSRKATSHPLMLASMWMPSRHSRFRCLSASAVRTAAGVNRSSNLKGRPPVVSWGIAGKGRVYTTNPLARPGRREVSSSKRWGCMSTRGGPKVWTAVINGMGICWGLWRVMMRGYCLCSKHRQTSRFRKRGGSPLRKWGMIKVGHHDGAQCSFGPAYD